MPQPLRKLAKPGIHLSLDPGLLNASPLLTALAMNCVSQWAIAERDFATLIISIVPGKARPIAELLIGARADSPKRAIRDALAASFLADDELPVFGAITGKYESCSKLRNPLVHWTLGSCRQVPDVIIAVNPDSYVQISADSEAAIDKMIMDMAGHDRPELKGSERITDETMAGLGPTYAKYVDAALAYREKDLSGILDEIGSLVKAIRHFRMIIRFRCLGVALDKRSELLQRLIERLGLNQAAPS